MQFQNPWGALAFLLIPVLVLLYLLKQRYQEKKVPSTFLWQKAANQWEASHPWQKWRKNLLFFLQLFALTCLILAFMQPVWHTQGMGENTVIVLDISLSMQAEESGKARLDKAKEEIAQYISRMQYGEQMSIILSGYQNELLIVKSSDKTELNSVLDKVSAQYGGSQLTEALQLAKTIQSEEENEVIYLFSDQELQQTDGQVVLRNLAEGAPNLALSSLSYARNSADNTLSVLGLVQNYAGTELATVELWCDGELVDVKDVPFKEEVQANVIFEGVSIDTRRIMLAISQEDALPADNYIYGVVQDDKKYRALLLTEQNVFLEKAIFLREDIELYKSNPTEELPLESYDLIIADGWATDTLPEGQDIWLINPLAENDWVGMADIETGVPTVSNAALAGILFNHVEIGDVAFAKMQGLDPKDSQAVPLVYSGQDVLVLAQDSEQVKKLAFGFDFHDSSFPMKKDFPILVQNILAWFLPLKEGQTNQITAHQSLPVTLQQGTSAYRVILPDQSEMKDQVQQLFINTEQLGFYRIVQSDEQGNTVTETDFAVNPASGSVESNLYTASLTDTQSQNTQNAFSRISQILPIIAVLALLIMLAEWWVYHRGS